MIRPQVLIIVGYLAVLLWLLSPAVKASFSVQDKLSASTNKTPPSVTLVWTNHPAPKGKKITLNNVYRCKGAVCIPAPKAIYTSTVPVTKWKDTTVVNSGVYAYAVTETVDGVESGYSNIVRTVVPKS